MILKLRWLLRLSSININPPTTTFKCPTSPSSSFSQIILCPEIIDSTISNCPSDTIALTFFLWAARQPNYFHSPLSFDRIVPAVLRLSLKLGLVSSIIRHLESFGCPIKAQTFLILLRIFWRGKKFRFALEVFDEMCRRKYKPNTYVSNIVIDIHFKTGRFEEAMRIYRETNLPNFLTFNTVLRHFCESGDWFRMRDLLREMVKRRFFLNDGTFLMASNCFCKAGRHTELLQLLAFMVVLGRHLSVMIWTILINSFCRNRRVETTFEYFRNMVESGCSPTVVTYTSFIKALCEAQLFCEVTKTLNLMCSNDCQPDLVLYNILISYLLKTRRYDVAIDVLILLLKRNLKPDSYTLSSTAFLYFSSRKMRLLLEFLTAGLQFKDDIALYNSLITSFCKVGLPSESLKVYEMMIVKGLIPDNYSYVGLIQSLCKLGRTEHAVYVYREIIKGNPNPNVDAYVHSAILDGLVKTRRYTAAVRLFRKAVSSEIFCLDVVSYTIAVHALFKSGRFDEAFDLFEQMKAFGPAPNIYTYNVMLCGLCKSRDFVGTKKLVKEMVVSGIGMDHISMNAITHLLLKFG